jgi:hydrogenase-4 component B
MVAGGAIRIFFALCGLGAILSLPARGRFARTAIVWIGALCSVALMAAAAARLAGTSDVHIGLWVLNGFGQLSLQVDALSAVFLFVAGLVYLSCCIFTPEFLAPVREASPAKRYAVLHFALMASVGLVLTGGDALTFLLGWECMSILCYLLVNVEEHESDSGAGYVMLAMSEAGFLAVVLGFLILGAAGSGFSFAALCEAGRHLSEGAVWAVFILGFLGFGVKAGLMPVNLWLPRCYTAAPPAFVPVLAGVTLNLGLYGILRMNGDLAPGHGVGTGLFALAVGSITALVGMLYATTESDMKTMLAHSSIENAGIIAAAFGAYLVFRNTGNGVPAALALTAALYHMVNHSVYKTLLFEGAGHIERATGTRDMDRLGGLIRALPSLSVLFLVGCLAISAIPPFNGFVSEWLTLQALLRSAVLGSPLVKLAFALAGAMLALTAALAVTCFVKTYAMTFLGKRRSEPALDAPAARKPRSALLLLAVACVLLGVLPTYVIPVLDRAVEPLAGASATAALVPPFFGATGANGQLPPAFLHDFHNLGAQTGSGVIPGRGLVVLLRGSDQNPVVFAMSPSYALLALILLLLVSWALIGRFTRRRAVSRREIWAGGIPKLLPVMTYTATGFSNPVRVVFQAIFRPNIVEDTRATVAIHFRTAIHRRRDETHIMDRVLLQPVDAAVGALARFFARLHHGRLNAYAGYVVLFLVVILFLYRLT